MLQQKRPDQATSLACLFICLGALASGGDALAGGEASVGYLLVFLNNTVTAFYSVYCNYAGTVHGVRSFELNFFIAFISLPLLAIWVSSDGSLDAMAATDVSDSGFVFWFFMSSVSGILITVSSIMVNVICSPIAYNVTGILKDVVLTALGFLCFSDVELTQPLALGLVLSFTGAGIYSYNGYQKQLEGKKQVDETTQKKK